MGYSTRSLAQLSRKLSPADIPTLISLVGDEDLRVGVQFALASQCEPAILPVREAAIQHKMDFLAASDTMDLIATFSACNPQTRNSAIQMHAELDKLRDAEYARTEQTIRHRIAVALHARLDATGPSDRLTVSTDHAVDPALVGAGSLRVHFEHDEDARPLGGVKELPVFVDIGSVRFLPCLQTVLRWFA